MKSVNKRKFQIFFVGAATGLINGFFGGGGGMVVVPMLRRLLGYDERCAHATAVAVILPVTAVSAFTYLNAGIFPTVTGFSVSIGVFLGGISGAAALGKLKPTFIEKLFSAAMFAAGIRMLLG